MEPMEPMFYLRGEDAGADLPEKVYLEPTSRCNLRCSICFRRSWIGEREGDMSAACFARLREQLPEIPGVQEVFFGGMGEPLAHPDICAMAAAFPTLRVSLLTNGTLLDRARSRALLDAGLSELWVSLDGFCAETAERIQLGGRFARIRENLLAFGEERAGGPTKLGVTFVVTPENVGELARIDDFADEMGVDLLNISHMIPGGPTPREASLYDRADIPVGRMRRLREPPPAPPAHVCPFVSRNSVFVRWDGDVAPCMQLLHGCHTYLDEEERTITRFSYGNVGSRTLLACWNDPEYRALRRRVRTFYFPFCTDCWGCPDRKENLTDCFWGEAPTCGACLWSTGKVFCP